MNDLRQITCTLDGPSETKRRNKTSRREFFFEVIYEEEVTMTKILSFAAIAGLLMASSPAVLAASQTSTRTPGHKMQAQHPNPHTRGTARGASSFSPGHKMQAQHPNPHTRGMARGASRFTPSR